MLSVLIFSPCLSLPAFCPRTVCIYLLRARVCAPAAKTRITDSTEIHFYDYVLAPLSPPRLLYRISVCSIYLYIVRNIEDAKFARNLNNEDSCRKEPLRPGKSRVQVMTLEFIFCILDGLPEPATRHSRFLDFNHTSKPGRRIQILLQRAHPQPPHASHRRGAQLYSKRSRQIAEP